MKRKYIKIVVVSILILCGALLSGAMLANIYLDSLLARIDHKEVIDDSLLSISREAKEKKEVYKVVNFAIFGTDNEGDKTSSERSDAIKVISLNYDLKTISITSFQRDIMIVLADESKDFDKLNHAYWYDGPTLAISTLNANFDLDINRYVSLNFASLEKIVDIVGGIDVELNGAEAGQLHLKSGVVHLNGSKALTYSRIRKIDSDYGRMDRQTKVILAVINEVKSKNIIELMDIVSKVLPYIETNLSTSEIKEYLINLLSFNLSSIEQYHVPDDDFNDTNSRTYKGYNPVYQLRSYEEQVKIIHKNIYGIDDYMVSDTVIENEKRIIEKFGVFIDPSKNETSKVDY